VLAAVGLKIDTSHKVKVQQGPSPAEKAVNMGVMMMTGLPLGIGKGKKEAVKNEVSSELFFYLDLLVRGPEAHYRVDAQHLDYAFLRDEKTFNVAGNFRVLSGKIAERSPAALKNKGLRAILGGGNLTTLGYDSMEDFERNFIGWPSLGIPEPIPDRFPR